MAEVLTAETLIFFLFFVVPGFVVISIYDVIVPTEKRNFGEAFVEIISYSFLILALSGWTYLVVVNNRESIGEWPFGEVVYVVFLGLSLVLTLVIVPVLVAVGYYSLRTSDSFGRLAKKLFGLKVRDPSPTPWDFVFKDEKALFVRFHLKEGGGSFGGLYEEGGNASSHPKSQQIYVTRLYRLGGDGKFVEEVEGTAGAIIDKEDCVMVEFLKVPPTEKPGA